MYKTINKIILLLIISLSFTFCDDAANNEDANITTVNYVGKEIENFEWSLWKLSERNFYIYKNDENEKIEAVYADELLINFNEENSLDLIFKFNSHNYYGICKNIPYYYEPMSFFYLKESPCFGVCFGDYPYSFEPNSVLISKDKLNFLENSSYLDSEKEIFSSAEIEYEFIKVNNFQGSVDFISDLNFSE